MMRYFFLPALFLLSACQAAAPIGSGPTVSPPPFKASAHEADWNGETGGLTRGQVGLARLEHPGAVPGTGDSEGAGRDLIPFYVDRAEELALTLSPGATRHTVELRGPNHDVLGRLDASQPRLRLALTPGRYRLMLSHDGSGGPTGEVPYFVKYASRPVSAAFRLLSTAPSTHADLAIGARVCPDCDMTGMNLSNADMTGAELPGAKLTQAFLDGANFHKANLKGADLSEVHGTRVGFYAANLEGARLVQASLQNSAFIGARLVDANMTGVDLSSTTPVHQTSTQNQLPGSSMKWADLSGANLQQANLKNVDMTATVCRATIFSAAILEQAEFTAANLESAVFEGVAPQDVSLQATVVKGVGFSRAYMAGANFRRVAISGTNFMGAILDRAQFQYANIDGASDFTGISGVEADFTQATIGPCSFKWSNMARSTFFGALVGGINVSGANLTDANFMFAPQSGVIPESLSPPTVTDGLVPAFLRPTPKPN